MISLFESTKITSPIKLDYKNLKDDRQKITNDIVFNSIKTKNIKLMNENINKKELERVLLEVNLSINQLIDVCSKNDIMNKILSGRISKNASRQGAKDEKKQLNVCIETGIQLGITIKQLSANAYRPTKKGKIISNEKMKQENISKDACLKSFDGKISGKIKGWIIAKNTFGSGGHQDNVFEELDSYCLWVKTFKLNKNEYYIIIWDTDNKTNYIALIEKYKLIKNLLVSNHYEFQKWMIKNYSN